MLRPYLIKSQIRQVEIEFDFSRIDVFQKEQMCTDWKMYESGLIHLVSNAVKYSPPNSVIVIELAKQPVEVEIGSFTYNLVTTIIDQGPGFNYALYRQRNYKTF